MCDVPFVVASSHCYRYACTDSGVGRLLVVMTEEAVVDVISGDTREELLSRALARHPGSAMIPDRGVHAHWVASVVRRIESPGREWSVPLDLRDRPPQRVAS